MDLSVFGIPKINLLMACLISYGKPYSLPEDRIRFSYSGGWIMTYTIPNLIKHTLFDVPWWDLSGVMLKIWSYLEVLPLWNAKQCFWPFWDHDSKLIFWFKWSKAFCSWDASFFVMQKSQSKKWDIKIFGKKTSYAFFLQNPLMSVVPHVV